MSKLLLSISQRPAFMSLAGNGVSALLGLLTVGVLARWMDTDGFGRWVIFQTVLGFFDTFRTGFLLNGLICYAAAASPDGFRRWAGAAWQLSLALTVVVGAGFVIFAYVAGELNHNNDLISSAWWLLLNATVGLPGAVATWLLHTKSRFKTLQFLRPTNQLLFIGFIGYGYLTHSLTDVYLYKTFALANGSLSLLTILMGWSELKTVLGNPTDERRQLIGFGRFAMPTLLFSHLLRSSDTLLIGALLGPASVARYAVPQRLIELLEMPVRSVVVTAMPRLAQLNQQKKYTEWASVFHRGAGQLWVALVPVAIICFVFAEPLVVLLGGEKRADSAILLRCFMVYAAFIPLERYSGVGLDAIGQPGRNLQKVILMLIVNVVGDLIAIYVFHSPVAVALISVGTFGTGLLMGYRWLGQYVPVSLGAVFRSAYAEIRQFMVQVRYATLR